jgi:mediator of RNA polymerase II transcription subunit 17
MIHAGLHLLLIRAHADNKRRRLLASTKANRSSNHAATGASAQQPAQRQPPPILQPFTDLIQYEAFCSKVHKEIERVGTALSSAGVPTRVRFNGFGDSNVTLLRMLDDVDNTQRIGGEAILRIDGRSVTAA